MKSSKKAELNWIVISFHLEILEIYFDYYW